MKNLKLSEVSARDIKSIARMVEHGIADYPWTQGEHIVLTQTEQQIVAHITAHLLHYETVLMNEATIWARAIYPLLVLAEQDTVQAWAQVPLVARYPHVELQGLVDGVLGHTVAGQVETPYLVVVEAKRSLESQNPRYQLYGQLLAAARLNWEADQQPVQELFGCYTISDIWTFLHAELHDLDSESPYMILETSREYMQKTEAETILRILKQIVATRLSRDPA